MSDFLRQMAVASAARAAAIFPSDGGVDAVTPLASDGFMLIAEFKRVSPAAGVLSASGDPTLVLRAQIGAYARGGATAISVLTEPTRFGGSLTDLHAAATIARAAGLPVMRKDFLVDASQIHEARAFGASGVLLIARMLDDDRLFEMATLTRRLGMFALIEAFDEAEVERSAGVHEAVMKEPGNAAGPALLLGLNCRDLATLRIDVSVFDRAAATVRALAERGSGIKVIAESGLETSADVARVAAAGYAGALVGSSLMRAADSAAACRQMVIAASKAVGAVAPGSKR